MRADAARVTWRGRLVQVTLMVGFSVVWAMFCNLVLEWIQAGGNTSTIVNHTLLHRPWVFLLGSTVVWMCLLLMWSLSGRLSWAVALALCLAAIIGYADYQKIVLRDEPLYPSDFGFLHSARFLGQMVGWGTILVLSLLVVTVTIAVAVSARILRRRWRRVSRVQQPALWYTSLGARAVVVVVTLAFLAYSTQFNTADNKLRAAYEAGGANWAFWYQKLNYYKNGFVGGMLYNLDATAMEEPAGYSRAAMTRIANKYAARAHVHNQSADPNALDNVNIVLILGEAFADPRELDGIEYASDPIPFTRGLMQHTTSGKMLAQLIGGGTANMEFEVLTGMSLSQFEPHMQTPYQMLVPEYAAFPSAVGRAKAQGRKPLAIHPYMTSMYQRDDVYPILGFDRFISAEDMPEAVRLEDSDFISDESAYRQAMAQIAAEDDPVLINLVTMQNHYPMRGYADPLPVHGVSGKTRQLAGAYGRGLRYSDEALKTLIEEMERAKEKIAVVFYGDHAPALWPHEIRDLNGGLKMRTTPFFLWANFPMEHRELPMTSPIYFLPLLYEIIGASVPPYYELLLEMHEHIPAMERGMYVGHKGEILEPDALSREARKVLSDYRMVQYDLSVGGRYSQNEMFYAPVALAEADSK